MDGSGSSKGNKTDLSQLITRPKNEPKVCIIVMREVKELLLSPRNSKVSSTYREMFSLRTPLIKPQMISDCRIAAANGLMANANNIRDRGHTCRVPQNREYISETLICMQALGIGHSNFTHHMNLLLRPNEPSISHGYVHSTLSEAPSDNKALFPGLSDGSCIFKKSLLKCIAVDLVRMKPDWSGWISPCITLLSLIARTLAKMLTSEFKSDMGR